MKLTPIQEIKCFLCGSSESKLFDRRFFRGELITNRICRACGFVYQSPRMSPTQLEEFYANEYRRLYQGDDGPVQKDFAVQKARAANLLEFTRSQGVNHLGRHLDIGSSIGYMLKTFMQSYHTEAVGVEPGLAFQETTLLAGLRIYSQLKDMSHQDEASFDLISFVHVLEHLPDPVRTLQTIRKEWVAPDGYLLIEVPNLYCHDCFEIAHLASFSQHSLQQILKKSGFKVTAEKLHGTPHSKILPLYITVLAQPASLENPEKKVEVVPETAVKIKRYWGFLKRKAIERLLPREAWV